MTAPNRDDRPKKPGTFPRAARLQAQSDFDRVYQDGRHAADATLVVLGVPNALAFSRLGLSVSRKVGGAVQRNRWKRLVREAFRTQRERLPPGFDWVVRPRRGATPEFSAISHSLRQLTRRVAGRWKEPS